jgi:hypothetical protein
MEPRAMTDDMDELTPVVTEIVAFARKTQEKHDMRNSELVSALLAAALSILNPK